MIVLMIILIIICAVILLVVLSNFIAKIVTLKRVEVTDKSIDECIEVIIQLKEEINELKQEITANNEKICEIEELYFARCNYVDKQLEYLATDIDQMTIILEEQSNSEFNNQNSQINPSKIEDLMMEKKALISRVEEIKQQMYGLEKITNPRHRQLFKQDLNTQMLEIKSSIEEYQRKERSVMNRIND